MPTTQHHHPGSFVLVVDDDDDIRATLLELLLSVGYRVCGAANGREALECLLTKRQPCLVLLDLNMPVMNGYEFLAALARDQRLPELRVVVMSAALTNKPDGVPFLTKPFEIDDLLAYVARHAFPPRN